MTNIMKRFLNFCNKNWNNAVIENTLVPTGMIPYNINKVG